MPECSTLNFDTFCCQSLPAIHCIPCEYHHSTHPKASTSMQFVRFSGHSHWAKIKHDKGKADVKRSATYAKVGKAIMSACASGGSDPGIWFFFLIDLYLPFVIS